MFVITRILALNSLHSCSIVHGRQSLQTIYLKRPKNTGSCYFALNILDTLYFCNERAKELGVVLFQSRGMHLGFSTDVLSKNHKSRTIYKAWYICWYILSQRVK